MTLAAIGVGVSAAGTIATASGGKGDEGEAAQQGVYDVMGQDRKLYLDKLRTFMTDPNQLRQSPGYQSRMKAGLDAVSSSGASRGLLDSGAMGIELQQKGQDMASQEYEAEFQRLAMLAGATQGSQRTGQPSSGDSAWSGVGGLFGAASNLYGRSTMGGGRGIFSSGGGGGGGGGGGWSS